MVLERASVVSNTVAADERMVLVHGSAAVQHIARAAVGAPYTAGCAYRSMGCKHADPKHNGLAYSFSPRDLARYRV